MSQRLQGTIKIWNDDKGYGFISPEAGGPDVFFHITSIINTFSRDLQGVRVTYLLGAGNDGKTAAINIRIAGAGNSNTRDSESRFSPRQHAHFSTVASNSNTRGGRRSHFPTGLILSFILLVLPFFATLAILARQHLLPWLIPGIYLVMSIVSFVVMKHDKHKSQLGYWRTSEKALHILEFWGGWPGSMLAQRMFRHKVSKASYQAIFWFIVVLHLGGWGFYFGNDHLPQGLIKTRDERPVEERIKITVY